MAVAKTVDASTHASVDAAVAACTPGDILYFPPGNYVSTSLLSLRDGVSVLGYEATLQLQAAGASLHIDDPSASYQGLKINGNSVALNPLKLGTTAGGAGAKAVLRDVQVQSPGPGGTAVAIHNLQNSYFSNFRILNSDLAVIGLLIDNGSKNLVFDGLWASSVNGPNLKITTSGGSQRTSKIFIRGGLMENGAGIQLEDCEQVYIRDLGLNSGALNTNGVLLVAGGNRDGQGPKMPSAVGIYGTQIKDWANAIHVAGLITTLHVGECSLQGSVCYKVEHTGARIFVVANNFEEQGTRFTSGVGAVESIVIKSVL